MVILLLTPIYWVIFLIVLFKGMFNAASKDAEKKKSGINQLIVAAVMLVIGVGVCSWALSGLSGMH